MKKLNAPSKKLKWLRKPIPTELDQRKRFKALAHFLRRGNQLTTEQAHYLADRFDRIGNGESADSVFYLKRTAGIKAADEVARRNISFIFSLVATWILPTDGPFPGAGLNLEMALEKASTLARDLFENENPDTYSVEYLKKLWHDPSYCHMRSPFRSPLDPDSPYPIEPLLK